MSLPIVHHIDMKSFGNIPQTTDLNGNFSKISTIWDIYTKLHLGPEKTACKMLCFSEQLN